MQQENAATVIGESILVVGQLSGEEDMTVLGRVEGSIDLSSTLFVANDGIVKADVKVGNAVISGIVIGNVTAEQSVQITETGRLIGDLRAPRVIITAGARVRGQVDMGGDQAIGQHHELSMSNAATLPAARRPAASSSINAAALARSPTGRFQRLSLPQRRPMPAASPTFRRAEAPSQEQREPLAKSPQAHEQGARAGHGVHASSHERHKPASMSQKKSTSGARSRRAAGRRRD